MSWNPFALNPDADMPLFWRKMKRWGKLVAVGILVTVLVEVLKIVGGYRPESFWAEVFAILLLGFFLGTGWVIMGDIWNYLKRRFVKSGAEAT